jgi:hypothetical protein
MPRIWRKTAGAWQPIKTVYRKTDSSWQSVKRVWRKTGGAWQLVFLQSLTPSISTKVEISTVSTSTQTKTLIGKLYPWSNSTSVTYQFVKSINDITYSNIAGASGTSTNPATSNTLDRYTLSQSDVTANTTNYYKYVSKASNSTFGTEQTSTSDYTFIEAPRDLSLTGTKTSTAITITWNNDTYSGRYEYQYKLTSDTVWSSSSYLTPGSTTTSFTISSLVSSTSYDFQVRGWTGTSNGYGYYGNWVSISVTTNAPAVPNPPTNITYNTISKDSYFIQWTSPSTDGTHDAATGFDFGSSSSSTTAPATQVTTAGVTNTQWKTITIADRPNNNELISSLAAGTTYYGWVRSRNAGGVSTWAVGASVTTTALKPPNNITNLAKDSLTDSETTLKFTFTAPTTDTTHTAATSYMYSYNTSNTAPSDGGSYETADSTASITISSLTANTTYYIFIKAKNADGLSSTWVSASGKTKATANPPGVPTSVSLANPSQSGLRFTWSAGTGGNPTSYVIALNTTGTEPTTENLFSYDNFYYDTTVTTTSYTFGSLSAGTTYYAWVKARNADGTSTSVRRVQTTAAAPTVGAPSWTSATNFQRVTSGTANFRWGWGNTGTLSPTTGTYTTMTRDGMFWEFYTAASGGTPSNSGYKSQTTTNDNRVAVNSVNYPYLLWSAGTSPDVTYSSNARYVRVQANSYDYEGKSWLSAWTARI